MADFILSSARNGFKQEYYNGTNLFHSFQLILHSIILCEIVFRLIIRNKYINYDYKMKISGFINLVLLIAGKFSLLRMIF